MAKRGGRDRGKERFWRGVLRRWRQSGQSVRTFCRVEGLAEPNFYSWRRMLAERDREVSATAAVGHGREDEQPGFDAATLRHLLAVVEEGSPC